MNERTTPVTPAKRVSFAIFKSSLKSWSTLFQEAADFADTIGPEHLAAMKGSIEARVYRREMSNEMERDEIAEAQKAARRWIDAGVVTLAA